MCGICGKLNFDQKKAVDHGLLKNMAAAMQHRGPDDEGFYLEGQIGLAHKRLSIIDLATGKQPISNENGKIWVVFNGEIYNYQQLRETLIKKGHRFKTKTDTEVIVHCYEEYGRECLSQLRGMFAFAIWNAERKELFLARDRVGIKPLYYSILKDSFLFGSEIKAILCDGTVPRDLDFPAINRFLNYLYLPGEKTLFKSVQKLPPAHYLQVKEGRVETHRYWDLKFSDLGNGNIDFSTAKEQLLNLLRETVRLHMISDVPVGFLLSGGVDSTGLLSLSLSETDKEISTFTIGFEGESFADERPYARMAANRYGTKHYDLTINARDFADFLPKYVWHMEEPVCEPPAVALYYISKLASQKVKVLISGEGGDEAFAGYQHYRNIVWLERIKTALGPLKGLGSLFVDKMSGFPGFHRIGKFSPLMVLPFGEYYQGKTSYPHRAFAKEYLSNDFLDIVSKEDPLVRLAGLAENVPSKDVLGRMLYIDAMTWLPDDLLVKADKMTMANSVELRVPLLDHQVLEFAASLPSRYKLHGFTTKFILKDTLKDFVPEEIIKRKKTGFPVPYQRWLRNDLKSSIKDILLDDRTIGRGYFEKNIIEGMLNNDKGHLDYSKEIFSLLTLELWHRTFVDTP